jgi:ribose transport system substrate-binding protein
MKRVFAIVAVFAALGLLTGCPRPASETSGPAAEATGQEAAAETKGDEQPAPQSRGTIGISLMTLTNPFFVIIGDTITEQAKKDGYATIVLSADENAAKQAEQIKDFIALDVAVIVLAPFDSKAIGPAIAEADNAGIPVFTVDNACLAEDCKVLSHVATDNLGGGRLAGELMIEALADSGGKIAVLDHKVTQSCLDRVTGFKEVIDKYNETAERKIEIVKELPSGGNRQTGYTSAKDVLQSDADIVGIFAINDPSALGAYAAVDEAAKTDQIKIIGFDGEKAGKEAIRDGKIYADPIQHPDMMGEIIVQYMMEYFDGKKPPQEKLIEATPYRQADGKADKSLGAD